MDTCCEGEVFYKHWILFPTVWHLPRLSLGRTQGKAKCGKKCSFAHENCQKPVTRHRYLAISQTWLKIDGYMLRGVWQALNSLSIHVTFTTIVTGAYPGEAKMCKKCAKVVNFGFYGLNYGKMVEDRWVNAAMSSLSIHVNLPRLSQGLTQGKAKCG